MSKIHKGMAMKRVHRIFGTTGKVTAHYAGGQVVERTYPVKSRMPSSKVYIAYVYRNGAWRADQAAAYFDPPKTPG